MGFPGNACDTQEQGCFGSVAYRYNIGTYEVTNAQYAEFLNAKVPDSDPLALWTGFIERSGAPAATATARSPDTTQTTCASPTAVPNHANCGSIELDLTDVGDYTGSASPYGTFDQGGNILEWTEAIIGSNRGLRGGGFGSPAIGLAASIRGGGSPSTEVESVGFRVPSLPEPGRDLVVMLSMLGLACLHRRHV